MRVSTVSTVLTPLSRLGRSADCQDMTAFIHSNATESITLVKTEADPELTEWCAKLAREYISLPVQVAELGE